MANCIRHTTPKALSSQYLSKLCETYHKLKSQENPAQLPSCQNPIAPREGRQESRATRRAGGVSPLLIWCKPTGGLRPPLADSQRAKKIPPQVGQYLRWAGQGRQAVPTRFHDYRQQKADRTPPLWANFGFIPLATFDPHSPNMVRCLTPTTEISASTSPESPARGVFPTCLPTPSNCCNI